MGENSVSIYRIVYNLANGSFQNTCLFNPLLLLDNKNYILILHFFQHIKIFHTLFIYLDLHKIILG